MLAAANAYDLWLMHLKGGLKGMNQEQKKMLLALKEFLNGG